MSRIGPRGPESLSFSKVHSAKRAEPSSRSAKQAEATLPQVASLAPLVGSQTNPGPPSRQTINTTQRTVISGALYQLTTKINGKQHTVNIFGLSQNQIDKVVELLEEHETKGPEREKLKNFMLYDLPAPGRGEKANDRIVLAAIVMSTQPVQGKVYFQIEGQNPKPVYENNERAYAQVGSVSIIATDIPMTEKGASTKANGIAQRAIEFLAKLLNPSINSSSKIPPRTPFVSAIINSVREGGEVDVQDLYRAHEKEEAERGRQTPPK